ncbi:MAG: hypothetical protein AAGK14_09925 [Verrucomicrobiota bacterium]
MNSPAVTELRASVTYGWIALVCGLVGLGVFGVMLVPVLNDEIQAWLLVFPLLAALIALGVGTWQVRRPPLIARRTGSQLSLPSGFGPDDAPLLLEIANLRSVDCVTVQESGEYAYELRFRLHAPIRLPSPEPANLRFSEWENQPGSEQEEHDPRCLVWRYAMGPSGGSRGAAQALRQMLPEVEVTPHVPDA